MELVEGLVKGLGFSATFDGDRCRTAATAARLDVATAVGSLLDIETSLEMDNLDDMTAKFSAFKTSVGKLGSALNTLPSVLTSCGASPEAEAKLRLWLEGI